MATGLALVFLLGVMASAAAVAAPIASAAPMRNWRRHVAADGSVRELNPSTREWVLVSNVGVGGDNVSPLLAIEGRRFEFDFAAGEFQVSGWPVVVLPAAETRDSTVQIDGDTGRTVWDAAVVLSKGFLEHQEATTEVFGLRGKHVLELGAGTGLAGMAAAVLGAHAVITDLAYCLPDIQRNVNATRKASAASVSVTVQELDWLRPQAFFESRDSDDNGTLMPFDIVLAADIVWLDHLVSPLVALLGLLLDRNAEMQFIFAHQTRSQQTDDAFFGELTARFRVVRVPDTELHFKFSGSKVQVFKATGL